MVDLQQLNKILDLGAELIPCWYGKGVYKTITIRSTKDFKEIQELIKKGYQVFRWIPGTVGLCAIDLDRHPGKPNGVETFFKLSGIGELPTNGPYVETPGRGYHFYFKTIERHRFQIIGEGIDFFSFGTPINAPGSFKSGKSYRLHGELCTAPPLPRWIKDRLKPSCDGKTLRRPYFSYDKLHRPPLDKIFYWASQSPKISGRNRLCYETSFRAAKYGYSPEEVENYLRINPVTAGHAQIYEAIKSGFKHYEGVL